MEYTEVKLQIKEKLPVQREFEDQDNLLELGLNSLIIMRLVNQWRKLGTKVSFGELMEHPTLEDWWKILQKGEKKKTERQEDVPLKDVRKPFPLTDVQYAYWVGRGEDQVLGGIGCHAYLEFDGEGVAAQQLEKAWNQLQNHHPMLRARFLEDGTQEIMEVPYSAKVRVNDCSALLGQDLDAALEGIRNRLSHRKLAVEKGEVAGIELTLLPQGRTRVHIDMDLLIADVQSLQILLRDLAHGYVGKSLPAASKDWNFATYLDQQEAEDKEERVKAKEYWDSRLADLPGGPELPLALRPEELKNIRFKRRIIKLDKQEWDNLQKRAAEYKTTPAMLLLAVYAAILERWSKNKHFLINIPFFNRKTEKSGLEEVIADFTTLLLLEVNCEGHPTFWQLLERLQKQLHQDMKYTAYSGVQVQRDLAQYHGGHSATAPLVFACNLGNPLVSSEFRRNIGEFTYMISQTPQVWNDFQTYEDETGLLLTWDCVEELFPEGMIRDMFGSLERLLHRLEREDWNQSFDVLPENQRKYITETCNVHEPQAPQCLHESFLKKALLTPNKIALIDSGEGITVTYGELRSQALSIAAALLRYKLKQEPVAISLPRGYRQIAAALGIVISGNIYVPISCEQPKDRRQLIQEKTGVHVVITDQRAGTEIDWLENTMVLVLEELVKEQPLPEYPEVAPADSAYIIMTSGSTGVPKGVEIAHGSAWNTILEINQRGCLGSGDTALAISAMDFDLSVYDVFGILGCGGKLVLIPETEKRNAEYWLEQIIEHQVTVWNSVPVLLDMLLVRAEVSKALLPLRIAMLSGDWVGLDLPERVKAVTKNCRFISLGGATEASIWSNMFEVQLPIPTNWRSIPYGSPLVNQAYRVVDDEGRDCPFWAEGELWIGGYGVAKGYRGDQKLTAEKFVEEDLNRWYRTGDNGRLWGDGTIEFLGIKDNQVKIRGHRIELGEIEHAVKEHQGIKNAVVEIVSDEQRNRFLAAYIEAPREKESGVVKRVCGRKNLFEAPWKQICENAGEWTAKEEQEAILQEFLDNTNAKSIRLMLKTLQVLGLFNEEKDNYTSSEILSKGRIIDGQKNTVLRWIDILKSERVLKETDGRVYYLRQQEERQQEERQQEERQQEERQQESSAKQEERKVVSLAKQEERKEVSLAKQEEFDEYIRELEPHMAGILTGQETALEVFYQEKISLAPHMLLKTLPGYQAHMEKLLQAVELLVRHKSNTTLRILEIGTRDLHMTKEILQRVYGDEIAYTYADSSNYFLQNAREELNEFEGVEYKLLYPEVGIGKQQFTLHGYDLILAFNSLHRSRDIERAVKQVDALLAPFGVLMLSELVAETYMQEITAAFLENGFGAITDQRKESSSVLIDSRCWDRCMSSFSDRRFIHESMGQLILLACQKDEVLVYTEEKLKEHLQRKIPEYMIPKVYQFMEQLPVSSSGKIDRKQLKEILNGVSSSVPLIQAATETEKHLLEIWRSLFGNSKLGLEDNYFTLGGDSLVATKLILEIQKAFQRKVPISAIFENPTVKSLANIIEETGNGAEELYYIQPEPEKENLPFPLTDVQYAYWIGRSGAYDLGKVATHCYFELDAEQLDTELAQKAWNVLIQKHGMMRVIVQPDGQQKILKNVPEYRIITTDMEQLGEKEKAELFRATREEMSHQVISTTQWPLFDVRMTRSEDRKYRIHISFDNLVFDGWSMFHILKEWADLYRGKPILKDITLSFRDYVTGLEIIKNSPIYEADQKYWMDRIPGFAPAPMLPLFKKENMIQEQRFHRRSARLAQEEWKALRRIAREIEVTPSVLLISAYAEVLRLWSANSDFTINLTQFDRKPLHPQVNQLVGDFTTLTLLEVRAGKAESFAERVKAVQKQLTRDLEHSFFSAIELERELKKQAGSGQDSIMPIVFTSGLGMDQWNEGQWLGKLTYNISQTPQVWLDHQVVEMDGELCLFWDSVDELFYPGMLDEMFFAYTDLLQRLAKEPALFEEKQGSLVKAKLSELRQQGNETTVEQEQETLDRLFLKAAEVFANKEALVTPFRRMSYREVKEEADYLSLQLGNEKLQKEETVAILMEKGWEQVVAAYGILFAGGAYLPIDPNNPKERIRTILVDSNTRIILTQQQLLKEKEWLEEWKCITVIGKKTSSPVMRVRIEPENLAYVIYTSGTTGLPKGVMITHAGAVNTILEVNKRYRVSEEDTALALSNLNFDLSVYDIFGLLGAGGKLVIPDFKKRKDPSHWSKLMNQEKVTVWNSVPAFLEMLIEHEEHQKQQDSNNLRLVLMSGDWIPVSLPGRIRNLFAPIEIISLGGATEASIWSNDFVIPKEIPEDWRSIPYGKPLRNQRYYILNSQMQNCPVWVPGMLYIAGVGVAKGYFNDGVKTEEKFIKHSETGERLYCTGDLGRYWRDGNIEFLGRMDSQVKLNGHRVELGEIKSAINKSAGVKDSEVLKIGDDRIVAFLIPETQEIEVLKENQENTADLEQYMEELGNTLGNIPMEGFQEYEEYLNKICISFMVQTLKRLGITQKHNHITIKELNEILSVRTEFENLMRAWLGALVIHGGVKKQGDYYDFSAMDSVLLRCDALNCTKGESLKKLSSDLEKNIEVCVKIMKNKGADLQALQDQEFLLLPDVLETYNLIQEDVTKAFLQLQSRLVKEKPRVITVVEIGNRMNKNTRKLLGAMDGRGRYIYVDVWEEKLQAMRQEFSKDTNFETYEYDIRQKTLYQGKLYQKADILIADNVLHRAPDLNKTLVNLRRMLKPGGILLIREYTENSLLLLCTVAFLEEGYAQLEDERKMAGLPLIDVGKWREKCFEAGFIHNLSVSTRTEEYRGAGDCFALAFNSGKSKSIDTEDILLQLQGSLPKYMIPYKLYELEGFPLNHNGKVDHAKLLSMVETEDTTEASRAEQESMTEMEAEVLDIWNKVLGCSLKSKRTNFFKSGGDSLKAIKFINYLKEKHKVDFKLSVMFENPDIVTIAAQLEHLLIKQEIEEEGVI